VLIVGSKEKRLRSEKVKYELRAEEYVWAVERSSSTSRLKLSAKLRSSVKSVSDRRGSLMLRCACL